MPGQWTDERLDDLAEDVRDLRAEMRAFRAEIRADMDALRTEIRADMDALRTEIRGEIGELRADLSSFKTTMLATTIAGYAAVVAAVLAGT